MNIIELSAYIDPGTGSMLLTIIIGLIATLIYALKGLWIKLKYLLSGGKNVAKDNEKLPYVIYAESKRYWNTFKPVCDEFEKRQIQVAYFTQTEDDPVFKEDYKYVKPEFIGEGSKGFARLNTLRAGVLLSTTPSVEVYQWKRSKNVDKYVHIYHAATEGVCYEMFGLDFYDSVLLTSSFQEQFIRTLEERRNLPAKDLEVVGCTYLDVLKKKYDEDPNKIIETETKTVLLAPSWGESCILNLYKEKILEALVGTGYNVIVRPHPQMKTADPKLLDELMKKFPDSEHFSWNFDNDNYEVLKKSDIMITDFSGVMTDFVAVFDKPFIYANTDFDKAPYDAAWLDGPIWRMTVLDEVGAKLEEKDFPRLKEVIDEVLTDDKYTRGREMYKNTLWEHEGESAKRIVDYVTTINTEKEEENE